MRLFYAIEFDEKTKDVLAEKQKALREKAVKGNFSLRDNLHLTLRFMGEVPQSDLPVLTGIQDAVSKRHGPFSLEFAEIGTFERGNSCIVWVGIKRNSELFELQQDLEREIAKSGFQPETRPYKPHITLAREFVPDGDLDKIIREMGLLNHKFDVKSISLMESTRINGKLTYLCTYRTDISKEK
ncbi:2'-5' RNA ligase [Thermoclostridium stercorarium subsp. stercorarium DSM 8532]|jgi:2'-5' RNA ligase|uniref:RNA 2',3'-cyclic phosphodiesterase n=3 Tax=Thermoclostridium stercorarium TaxID=1510 RepID=L7VIM6_THES1|nr:RNA 2',3'-cyclic phosphodiesterase [Thermoclostridium stercorarium]AGC67915.1 2'-5' RNA ligase [Thermoclostridium stercorarium subsp. stercorarium DSM 8532]AGI38955.1 2-5 RNA ligase [Thermoclostridium stercorarium subsp. stercorarium DSM 8532]ANW98324.1 2'-5' RNA ligase [Thermoclostridium stercorarium subsp. thermolacticum DSM 2910]ANX00852.1 2'-5' RNA ligase [Thermoclostridium stercorarium subsp. leptospartum DSM 9219]UZQ86463.1 RNA 2',3'-cyclic phosphodiesterase [Thermoclostridium stercor